MRDDFSPDGIPANGSQATAVEAVGASSLNVNLGSFRVERSDAFDQCPVELVFKNDGVPNFESLQKEGNRSQYDEIPILKVGRHRVAGDFVDAKHRKKISLAKASLRKAIK